jgi:hypothetical protein
MSKFAQDYFEVLGKTFEGVLLNEDSPLAD